MRAEALEFVGHARRPNMTGNPHGTVRDGPRDGRLRLVFPSGETAVRRALSTATGAFTGIGLPQYAKGLAEIVLAEALNNVVEHAYAEHSRGLIEVEAWLEGPYLWMIIRDDGLPMPGGILPERREQDVTTDLDDLPEGGFGWSIIHDLTHDLTYERDGLRNTVTFSLDLQELESAT